MRDDWDELFVCDWGIWDRQTEEQRESWRAWARHHGIDPNTILVPGWVAVFRADRQIHYLSYAATGSWEEFPVVVQLEAEPSRFPR